MINFDKFAIDARQKIINNLEEYFSSKKGEGLPVYFYNLELLSSLSSLVPKGKLLRGTLFLLACQMYNVKRTKEIINIASAIELLHTGMLIHDDIIDSDELRRGMPTINAYFKKRGEKINAVDPYHYGISMAILVGDIAYHCAMELLSSFNEKSLGKLLKYYAVEINKIGIAEGADTEFGLTKREPKKGEILAIYKYKTARYTFAMPFTMAGMIAGVSEKQIETMEEIGELAGLIFQMKDDELGLLGSEEEIGKPVGSDIRENKKTIIRELLYARGNKNDKKILNSLFGKKTITTEDIGTIKGLLKKYEIEKELENQIQTIENRIKKLFEGLEIEEKYKIMLREILLYNMQRKN